MKKPLHILIVADGAYEDYTTTVVGVTDDTAVSHAFLQVGMFAGTGHEVEIVTLNVLDGDLRQSIDQWLDSAQNPICTCGHRLLHHRLRNGKRGAGSCKHNVPYKTQANYHFCKGFSLAKEQPKIEF